MNYDAHCNNCRNYTRKAQCRKAFNTKIDYTKDDNPFCYDWKRSFKSIIKKLLNIQ
jgi:hypothetical protein